MAGVLIHPPQSSFSPGRKATTCHTTKGRSSDSPALNDLASLSEADVFVPSFALGKRGTCRSLLLLVLLFFFVYV